MKLVIAEKPELAKDIAGAILRNGKYEGGVIYDDSYTIISAFGHLLKLCSPDEYNSDLKAWRMETLPITFQNWKKVPDKSKEERLNLIGQLMRRSDCECIINAGDPDDEGQLLVDEIIDYFGFTKPVYRVYINDNIGENIRAEFRNLKDNKECRRDGDAAYARQMADYCFGINESRLVSIKNKCKLSVGRVQTPTLGLIVNRDEAIAKHIKQKYYEIFAACSVGEFGNVDFKFIQNKELYGERIEDISTVKNLTAKLSAALKSCTCSTTVKQSKSSPPLPYNHTKLCGDMSKRYGYTLEDVNTILQNLREKYKAITYNRTDCQYLKEEHYEQAPALLPVIFKNTGKSYPCDTSIHSACFNDKNVSAHHAIIPQKREIDISQMSEKERNVYTAICERYIMQFLPPLKYEESISVIDLGQDGRMEYKSKKLIRMGFKEFFGGEENDDFSKIFISAGQWQTSVVEVSAKEKETSPPKPYQDQTLIDDMASIAKYVQNPDVKKILIEKDKEKKGEHGGIGTVATRVSTIETLFKRGFIERKGKSIVSTQLGREFYHLLPQNIKTADITAKWWLLQEEVRAGRLDVNAIQNSVVEEFLKHKDAYTGKQIQAQAQAELSCPFCGRAMKELEKSFSCTGYKDGCSFTIWKVIAGKKITKAQAKALCENWRTGELKGFMGKSGKEFSAKLVLNKSTGKIEFEFAKRRTKK